MNGQASAIVRRSRGLDPLLAADYNVGCCAPGEEGEDVRRILARFELADARRTGDSDRYRQCGTIAIVLPPDSLDQIRNRRRHVKDCVRVRGEGYWLHSLPLSC